ncbi:MAG: proline dehydrogenase [Chrysothrix sp. TS-e1954]|nr:MAG: proline dehydrogenase [Chrysothrix sp. TS-e1954]
MNAQTRSVLCGNQQCALDILRVAVPLSSSGGSSSLSYASKNRYLGYPQFRLAHSARRFEGQVLPEARTRRSASSHAAGATRNDLVTGPRFAEPVSDIALGRLPLPDVLRSYAIMTISSSPVLLATSTKLLQGMIDSKSRIFDVDSNLLLRWLLKITFYNQFCAGEDGREVKASLQGLRRQGYEGVILEYANEIMGDLGNEVENQARAAQDIEAWKDGLLKTVAVTEAGDWVGLKWSGMGAEAMRLLRAGEPPSPQMAKAMTDVCDAAVEKQVRLLPAAEPQIANAAVEDWTLDLARKYNKLVPGQAIIYNTIQCYLKSVFENLSKHLSHARQHDYVLGVKLVRGAYLATEPRHLIWDSKEKTDMAYDEAANYLLADEKTSGLVNVMIASHNRASVDKVRQLRQTQVDSGEALVPVAYAQLKGMADELSLELLQAARTAQQGKSGTADRELKTYKCVSWGSTRSCLEFLLRRAAENKDAMSRTIDTKRAMGHEIRRRLMKPLFG